MFDFQIKCLLLFFTIPKVLAGSSSVAAPTEIVLPNFLDTPTNISTQEGQHAFLPCRVDNLGDRSVTWIRRGNLHIIAAGQLTYAPDNRYRVLHQPGTNEWTLHIKLTEVNDTGWYECQVNSDPKITRAVTLIVQDKNLKDPFYVHKEDRPNNNFSVVAEGPAERYMQAGSILSIKCSVFHDRRSVPEYIWWYQGGIRLEYNSSRGGISIQTDKSANFTYTKLKLSAVTAADSGRYTCRPSFGGSAAVTIHVQDGQHQAAVQLNSAHPSLGLPSLGPLAHFFCAYFHRLTLFIYYQYRYWI